jgi:ER lumen protein retaining receptor
MCWTFSIILESVCVLPQLLLLRQTSVPTVIDSFYLVTLGSYRGFYILNWIVRAAGSEHYFDPVSVLFGIVQTVLYIDFAWVYWTRQRVKLRNGGIVDSDDLRKSWVVGRMLGGRTSHSADEEGQAGEVHDGNSEDSATGQQHNRWGSRGVSVAADDTLQDHSRTRNSGINHPDEFNDILEDEDDDESAGSSNARHDDR